MFVWFLRIVKVLYFRNTVELYFASWHFFDTFWQLTKCSRCPGPAKIRSTIAELPTQTEILSCQTWSLCSATRESYNRILPIFVNRNMWHLLGTEIVKIQDLIFPFSKHVSKDLVVLNEQSSIFYCSFFFAHIRVEFVSTRPICIALSRFNSCYR